MDTCTVIAALPSCASNSATAITEKCLCKAEECGTGKWCWADKCRAEENPCKAGGAYCGPLGSSGSAYLKDFSGACSTCTTAAKDCKDMSENYVAKGKCHAECAVGWTKEAEENIAISFKCTASETTAMNTLIADSAGKTTPASAEMSGAASIQGNAIALFSAFIVGIALMF
jgi:hypothetical protein